MLKKIVLYSFLFLLSLALFLVLTAPARVVWDEFVASELPLKRMGVSVLGVDGSIWDGRAHVKYRNLEHIVSWELVGKKLLTGKLALSLDIDGHVGSAAGLLEASFQDVYVTLDEAEVDIAKLNPFFKRQRVSLDGTVVLQNLEANLRDQRLISAFGKASWTGGKISYPVGRRSHERDMPAFSASLDTVDGVIRAGVKDADATFNVIDVVVDNSGEMLLEVRRRLLDLADEPARHKSEQDVVFKMKKDLYATL